MMIRTGWYLAGASALGLAGPALAQEAPQPSPEEASLGMDSEIIVSARRRDESLQDVPLTVQAVTGQELDKLNLTEFRDIQTIVPGLSLGQDANGIGTRATLRGIAYDVNASGNNGTIEFYLNDAPTSAAILFQSMFDVGQIEVLRGPQGTLRGRASPSGSITVTTRRPDLYEAGFSGNGLLNKWGDFNLQGAINIPVVEGIFGVRFAGVIDDTDDNRIHSLNDAGDPERQTQGGRVSLRFEPTANLKFNAVYTQTIRDQRNYLQVESANLADPSQPASPVLITPDDRLAVGSVFNSNRQSFKVWNWSAQWSAFGQVLNYVGSHNRQHYQAYAPNDPGAALPATAPDEFRDAAQVSDVNGTQTNHEIRLSSETRIGGFLDYVVGALFNKTNNPTSLDIQTPVFLGSTAAPLLVNHTAVLRTGGTSERSFFGNLTAHLGEKAEISGGIRRIRFHSFGGLDIGGVPLAAADEDRVLHATIYSASAKYNVTPDLMVYASFGTSWRPGSATNPIQLRNQSMPYGVLASLFYPDAEKSKSYEVGFKSQWLDRRLTVNGTFYHQTFDNFAYAAPNIFYISDVGGTTGVRTITTLTVGVPARVNGVELEMSAQPVDNWSIAATASYADGKISNATIPCNPYNGVPTAQDILDATGGEQVAVCEVGGLRAGTNAPFVANLQSEYFMPLSSSIDGYVRGLATIYGDSRNDPTNPYDDISSYALVNAYAGLRDPDGGWDLGVYAKNLFNVERVLTRNASPSVSGASVVQGEAPVSTYRVITTTPAREIGVTLRIAFGSR